MAAELRTLTLNSRTYSIHLPPPTQAMPLVNRTAVLIGAMAPLFADIHSLGEFGDDSKARIAACLGKFGEALQSIDPVALHQLTMDAVFVAHLTCENKPISIPIDFDRHFEEFRSEAYQVVIWCLWECVVDFFPQLGALTQPMKQAAHQAFQSPRTGL